MTSFHPFLPALRHLLGPRKNSRPPQPALSETATLQWVFERFFPAYLLAQNDDGLHSRERCWTLRLVFWTFLYQVLHPGSSCRQAIHAAFCPEPNPKRPIPSVSSYCQARLALPLDVLDRIKDVLALKARQMAPSSTDTWKGWNLKVADGTSSSMPDTPSNQTAWPQPSVQKQGCGFPVMRWAGLFCLASGALLAMACGSLHGHDLRLFQQLWDYLKPKDLLVADRGFSSYAIYARIQMQGMAAVFRLKQAKALGKAPNTRRRKIKRLGKGDCLIRWDKPFEKPRWMEDIMDWICLPPSITLRLVTVTVRNRQSRPRRIIIATTLLDPKEYPAAEIAALYARRWEVEGLIRHMKTTMQMEVLRCKSSAMIEKEVAMHQIAYNLVICLILESSGIYFLNPLTISFAGTLSAIQACAQSHRVSKRKRRKIEVELLNAIAVQKVPKRPGRKEPRAVKRRPKPYSMLIENRKIFVEIHHRSQYRKKRKQ